MGKLKTVWLLIGSQIIYVLLVVVWLFIAGMSVMGFDSPQAATDPTTWIVFIYIWLYPVGLLVTLIAVWICFYRRRYRAALIWNSVPFIWILPFLGLLVYILWG